MVAVSPPRFRSSVLESVVSGVAARRAKRRKQSGRRRVWVSVLLVVLGAVGDSAGTVLAGVAVCVGGFEAVTWLGWMLTGLAVLVVDFELTRAVRRRVRR
jgi:hypothetical protein